MAERYDLVVVGAGPGGSSAAYYSAKAGLSTLLIDRQEFPRDKTCGDGLMPHAASEVALMGLADWLDEPHHGKFTGFSIYTHTAFLRQNVPPTLHGPNGYVVKREETDARLLERAVSAGAELRTGVRATDLVRSASGAVTGLEAVDAGEDVRFDAPLVVAADGIGGFAGNGMKAHQNAVARRQYFRNVEGPDKQDLHVFITEDMNSRGAGYGWVFYLGDGTANVGAGSRPLHWPARAATSKTSTTAFLTSRNWRAGYGTPRRKARREAGRSRWVCGARNATGRG